MKYQTEGKHDVDTVDGVVPRIAEAEHDQAIGNVGGLCVIVGARFMTRKIT
jgi:hypothetical protein